MKAPTEQEYFVAINAAELGGFRAYAAALLGLYEQDYPGARERYQLLPECRKPHCDLGKMLWEICRPIKGLDYP